MEAKRILVIEDERRIADILRINLEAEGFQVITAENGVKGLEKALDFHPDLITLDVLMPGKNGWETLRCLKGDERTRDIPVVMITVVPESEQAMNLGASYYILKPFRIEEVLEVIQRELGLTN